MINYSIVMRNNPVKKDSPKKAYACVQYAELMNINRFAEHIASHGCVYSRADVVAILTLSVDCMRELLLAGQKIQLGDLGDFSLGLSSIGANTAQEFTSAQNIKRIRVNYTPGDRFCNLIDDATFNLVPTRKAAQAVVKALKTGEKSVDLSKLNEKTVTGSIDKKPVEGGGDTKPVAGGDQPF